MKKIKFLAAAICLAFTLTACAEHEPASTGGSSDRSDNSSSMSTTSSEYSSLENSSTHSSLLVEYSSSSSVLPETPPEIVPQQEASLFYCVEDDKLLESVNINEYVSSASLLKVFTASVALHYVSPDKVFTVGTEQQLVPAHSSLCLISSGHRLKLYDLITGMLLPSGNDAAYTIAVSVAREVSGKDLSDKEAVEYFAGLMNLFAKQLGMDHSHFVNPDGSDDERQYTTVYDLMLAARYAITVPEIREIAFTLSTRVTFESGHVMSWRNSNKLIDPESEFYCEEATGLKTGTTDNAGYNLIGVFNKNGKTYIFVAAGCKSGDERYKLALEYLSKV